MPTRVGRRRDREWINDEFFQLLDAFEHDLGASEAGTNPTFAITDSTANAPSLRASLGRLKL